MQRKAFNLKDAPITRILDEDPIDGQVLLMKTLRVSGGHVDIYCIRNQRHEEAMRGAHSVDLMRDSRKTRCIATLMLFRTDDARLREHPARPTEDGDAYA